MYGTNMNVTRTGDGYWRNKTNQEINDILKGQNIIGIIKNQKLNWLGHNKGIFVYYTSSLTQIYYLPIST